MTPGDNNITTTDLPDEEFWESIGSENNNSNKMENIKDVEILFQNTGTDDAVLFLNNTSLQNYLVFF